VNYKVRVSSITYESPKGGKIITELVLETCKANKFIIKRRPDGIYIGEPANIGPALDFEHFNDVPENMRANKDLGGIKYQGQHLHQLEHAFNNGTTLNMPIDYMHDYLNATFYTELKAAQAKDLYREKPKERTDEGTKPIPKRRNTKAVKRETQRRKRKSSKRAKS